MAQRRKKKSEQTADVEQTSSFELGDFTNSPRGKKNDAKISAYNTCAVAFDDLMAEISFAQENQEALNPQDMLVIPQELKIAQAALQSAILKIAESTAAQTKPKGLAQSILSNVEQLINKTEPEELSKQFGSFLTAELESGDSDSESLLLLELENLKLLYERRQKLLENSLTSTQVAELLGWKNRKTVHDRLKANKIIGIKNKSQVKFPIWQFDPDGDDGILDGLPQLLSALKISDFRKLSWLTKPLRTFEGKTPVKILKRGDREEVKELIIEAEGVGVLQ